MTKYDWLIVGAGFSGGTLAERIATKLGQRVLVIDQRPHIGGNAYDERDAATGETRHVYGPHIFHTNSRKVWDYLSRFTAWRPYFHRVLGSIEGTLAPLPFNLNSIEMLFPRILAERFTQALLDNYRYGERVPILKLRTSQNEDLRFLAEYIFDNVFLNYTVKQWELRPEQLAPSVTARVPIAICRDDRYFTDVYQAIPANGYTALFDRMLSHELIDVRLGAGFADVAKERPAKRVIYTGPIDAYFKYALGPLPYRTMNFHSERLNVPRHQAVGTVNYPNNYDFTRITEMRHLDGRVGDSTLLIYEFPQTYEAGRNEPHYPIPTDENQLLLRGYQDLARKEENVLFCGRLGDYKYYNMDQAVGAALALFEKDIKPQFAQTVSDAVSA